ncbi:hypothetical protein GCM10018965_019310 [Nonomuraea roseola]
MSITTDPLLPGSHTVSIGGVLQRYHVAGAGPVCLVHPGGPGIGWEYLRMPELERHLTVVYLDRSAPVRPAGCPARTTTGSTSMPGSCTASSSTWPRRASTCSATLTADSSPSATR